MDQTFESYFGVAQNYDVIFKAINKLGMLNIYLIIWNEEYKLQKES